MRLWPFRTTRWPVRKPRSYRRCSPARPRVSYAKPSTHKLADSVVPDGEGEFPDFPDPRALILGEEDDFRLADEVLERNIADVRPAVG